MEKVVVVDLPPVHSSVSQLPDSRDDPSKNLAGHTAFLQVYGSYPIATSYTVVVLVEETVVVVVVVVVAVLASVPPNNLTSFPYPPILEM